MRRPRTPTRPRQRRPPPARQIPTGPDRRQQSQPVPTGPTTTGPVATGTVATTWRDTICRDTICRDRPCRDTAAERSRCSAGPEQPRGAAASASDAGDAWGREAPARIAPRLASPACGNGSLARNRLGNGAARHGGLLVGLPARGAEPRSGAALNDLRIRGLGDRFLEPSLQAGRRCASVLPCRGQVCGRSGC